MSATLRPGWTMPTPPDGGPWEPLAYIIGGADGVDLYWIPKGAEDIEPDVYHHIPWPFGDDDIAHADDFRALGFRVEW